MKTDKDIALGWLTHFYTHCYSSHASQILLSVAPFSILTNKSVPSPLPFLLLSSCMFFFVFPKPSVSLQNEREEDKDGRKKGKVSSSEF